MEQSFLILITQLPIIVKAYKNIEVIRKYILYFVKPNRIAKMKIKTVKKIFLNMFSLKLLRCKPIRFTPRKIKAIDKV